MEILYPFYAFFIVFATLFGIVIGSFLNVVIYRVPAGRTISKGRSMCMSCDHELAAKDLVPLFSWLFLRGKCRYCGAPVASRYAKIESLTGLIFMIAAIFHKESGLWIIDIESVFMLDFIYYCLFAIASAAVISAMMIYHDTQKGFIGVALFSLIPGLLSTVVLTLYGKRSYVTTIKYLGIAILLAAAFVGLNALASKVTRKLYNKYDFALDMTFAGIMLFASYLWVWRGHYLKSIITFVVYAIAYVALRQFMKGKKADKFTAIISASVVVILLIIRYLILVF